MPFLAFIIFRVHSQSPIIFSKTNSSFIGQQVSNATPNRIQKDTQLSCPNIYFPQTIAFSLKFQLDHTQKFSSCMQNSMPLFQNFDRFSLVRKRQNLVLMNICPQQLQSEYCQQLYLLRNAMPQIQKSIEKCSSCHNFSGIQKICNPSICNIYCLKRIDGLIQANQQSNLIFNNFIFQYPMKEFSHEYSPIQYKNLPNSNCCEQMLQKIDIKDISNISHKHNIDGPNNYSNVQQRVTTTAKTLLYLFSPEIDLLQSLENKVQHYDKFQRTKLILKQLINSVHYRFDKEIDLMKAQEEISKISNEFQHLKCVAQRMQKQGYEKDRQIQNLKASIIKLSKAYQEVKQCYEEQLLQMRFQCQQLRIKINSEPRNTRVFSKSKKNESQYSINLKLPKERKRKQNHKYTDSSMYVRFSASQLQQNENVLTSMAKNEQLVHNNSETHSCSHMIKVHQLQLEKETLQAKLRTIEDEYKKLSSQYLRLTGEFNLKNEELQRNRLIVLQEFKAKDEKIAEKNRVINELLEIIQNSP